MDRTIRMDETLWEAAQLAADLEHMDISEWLCAAARAYLAPAPRSHAVPQDPGFEEQSRQRFERLEQDLEMLVRRVEELEAEIELPLPRVTGSQTRRLSAVPGPMVISSHQTLHGGIGGELLKRFELLRVAHKRIINENGYEMDAPVDVATLWQVSDLELSGLKTLLYTACDAGLGRLLPPERTTDHDDITGVEWNGQLCTRFQFL